MKQQVDEDEKDGGGRNDAVSVFPARCDDFCHWEPDRLGLFTASLMRSIEIILPKIRDRVEKQTFLSVM